jgi:hypothetical protein
MSNISIKNIHVFNLLPNKRFNINIEFPPQYIGFEIHNVNTSITNAIRRVCEGEILTKRLVLQTLNTNDVYMINEFLNILIKSLPVSQSIPNDKQFNINIKSNSMEDFILTTSDIKGADQYLNKNMPLATICGRIKNSPKLDEGEPVFFNATLKVVENYGYLDGAFNQCESGGSIMQYIDTAPRANGGSSATEAYPTAFYVKMTSKGGISPNELFKNVISTIITRLRSVQEVCGNIEQDINGIYKVTIEETITIGELIFVEVHDLDPDNESFMYNYRDKNGFIIFRSRSSDMNTIISNAVNSLIKKFNIIGEQFKDCPKAVDCHGFDSLKEHLLNKYNHLPLIGDSAEVAAKKSGIKGVTGGWVYLLNRIL